MATDYIQVDETTLPVEQEEKHKTIRAYIWMVRSVMQPLQFFHYDCGSRAHKVVLPLLADFRGALQTISGFLLICQGLIYVSYNFVLFQPLPISKNIYYSSGGGLGKALTKLTTNNRLPDSMKL